MSASFPLLRNPFRRLRPGCYLAHYTPDRPYRGTDAPLADLERAIIDYLGTLRVVHYDHPVDDTEAGPASTPNHGEFIRLSGDFYAFPREDRFPDLDEIPIFSRDDYRFHVRSTAIRPWSDGGFDMVLESREFQGREWGDPEVIVLRLAWVSAPEEALSPFDYLDGEVWLGDAERLGRITVTWVSQYLRRAVVELDAIGGLAAPKEATLPVTTGEKRGPFAWQDAFGPAGWLVTVESSDQPDIASDRVWAEFELQQALPALRDSNDTDHEWRYHVFCVAKLEDQGRGYQFDARGTDGTDRYFESIVLAARFEFPDSPEWGALKNQRLEQTPLYFRVAVHEVGHAMKLEHNDDTCGFMATTDAIRQVAAQRDKSNPNITETIEWSFAPRDLERLRHWPDLVVRPGGPVPHLPLPGIDGSGPGSFEDPDLGVVRPHDLVLEVRPLLDEFPIGAPVRLDLRLHHRGKTSRRVPLLRLKAGNLSGWVKRGDWVLGFLPMARSIDDRRLTELGPDQLITGSICLLRGPDGPLFGVPGPSTVTVRLEWYDEKVRFLVSGTCNVQIAGFSDTRHLKVARKLIETQDTLAGFAIGGDGFADGNQAINLALANPILKPHFAVIRFRRMIRDSGSHVGNLLQLLDLLCLVPTRQPYFLTGSEVGRLADLLAATESRNEGVLGAEKMQIAIRVILGRLSDATFKLLSATPGGLAAARGTGNPDAASPSLNPNLSAVIGNLATRPTASSAASHPTDAPPAFARQQPAPTRAVQAGGSAGAPLDRDQLWKLGLRPNDLGTLRELLRNAAVDPLDIARAGAVVVRALHRHSPARLVARSLDIHAALVANFLANLVIAEFEIPESFLRAAVTPFEDLSDLDNLIALAGQGSSAKRLGQQVVNALQNLPDDSNHAFGSLVARYLDSGPYDDGDQDKVRTLKADLEKFLNP